MSSDSFPHLAHRIGQHRKVEDAGEYRDQRYENWRLTRHRRARTQVNLRRQQRNDAKDANDANDSNDSNDANDIVPTATDVTPMPPQPPQEQQAFCQQMLSCTYPNGPESQWQYETVGQLLTQWQNNLANGLDSMERWMPHGSRLVPLLVRLIVRGPVPQQLSVVERAWFMLSHMFEEAERAGLDSEDDNTTATATATPTPSPTASASPSWLHDMEVWRGRCVTSPLLLQRGALLLELRLSRLPDPSVWLQLHDLWQAWRCLLRYPMVPPEARTIMVPQWPALFRPLLKQVTATLRAIRPDSSSLSGSSGSSGSATGEARLKVLWLVVQVLYGSYRTAAISPLRAACGELVRTPGLIEALLHAAQPCLNVHGGPQQALSRSITLSVHQLLIDLTYADVTDDRLLIQAGLLHYVLRFPEAACERRRTLMLLVLTNLATEPEHQLTLGACEPFLLWHRQQLVHGTTAVLEEALALLATWCQFARLESVRVMLAEPTGRTILVPALVRACHLALDMPTSFGLTALQALNGVMNWSRQVNRHLGHEFELRGGVELLQRVQMEHADCEVVHLADTLLDRHWPDEGDECGDGLYSSEDDLSHSGYTPLGSPTWAPAPFSTSMPTERGEPGWVASRLLLPLTSPPATPGEPLGGTMGTIVAGAVTAAVSTVPLLRTPGARPLLSAGLTPTLRSDNHQFAFGGSSATTTTRPSANDVTCARFRF